MMSQSFKSVVRRRFTALTLVAALLASVFTANLAVYAEDGDAGAPSYSSESASDNVTVGGSAGNSLYVYIDSDASDSDDADEADEPASDEADDEDDENEDEAVEDDSAVEDDAAADSEEDSVVEDDAVEEEEVEDDEVLTPNAEYLAPANAAQVASGRTNIVGGAEASVPVALHTGAGLTSAELVFTLHGVSGQTGTPNIAVWLQTGDDDSEHTVTFRSRVATAGDTIDRSGFGNGRVGASGATGDNTPSNIISGSGNPNDIMHGPMRQNGGGGPQGFNSVFGAGANTIGATSTWRLRATIDGTELTMTLLREGHEVNLPGTQVGATTVTGANTQTITIPAGTTIQQARAWIQGGETHTGTLDLQWALYDGYDNGGIDPSPSPSPEATERPPAPTNPPVPGDVSGVDMTLSLENEEDAELEPDDDFVVLVDLSGNRVGGIAAINAVVAFDETRLTLTGAYEVSYPDFELTLPAGADVIGLEEDMVHNSPVRLLMEFVDNATSTNPAPVNATGTSSVFRLHFEVNEDAPRGYTAIRFLTAPEDVTYPGDADSNRRGTKVSYVVPVTGAPDTVGGGTPTLSNIWLWVESGVEPTTTPEVTTTPGVTETPAVTETPTVTATPPVTPTPTAPAHIPVTAIDIDMPTTIAMGTEPQVLPYSVEPSNATNRTVVWSATGADVAVTATGGNLTITVPATPVAATVTATIENGTAIGVHWSHTWHVSVYDPALEPLPTPVGLEVLGDGGAITWTRVANAVSYRVYLSLGDGNYQYLGSALQPEAQTANPAFEFTDFFEVPSIGQADLNENLAVRAIANPGTHRDSNMSAYVGITIYALQPGFGASILASPVPVLNPGGTVRVPITITSLPTNTTSVDAMSVSLVVDLSHDLTIVVSDFGTDVPGLHRDISRSVGGRFTVSFFMSIMPGATVPSLSVGDTVGWVELRATAGTELRDGVAVVLDRFTVDGTNFATLVDGVVNVQAGGNVLFGDVNNDGIVNAVDVLLIRQHAAGFWMDAPVGDDVPGWLRGPGANVNNDATVNAADVLLIRQHAAGFWMDADAGPGVPGWLPAPGPGNADLNWDSIGGVNMATIGTQAAIIEVPAGTIPD